MCECFFARNWPLVQVEDTGFGVLFCGLAPSPDT